MGARIFGSAIKRREDPRLITGQAKFTDDFVLPGMAHLAVVRSPYAHARIKAIRTKKAAAMEGVLGVFTGKDMKEAGFGPIPCAWVGPRLRDEDSAVSADRDRPRPLRRNAVAIVVADGPLSRPRCGRRRGSRLRALAGRHRSREGDAEGPPQAPRRRPGQPGASTGTFPAAMSMRRSSRGHRREGAHPEPAPDPERHRAVAWRSRSTSARPNEFTLWVTSQNPHIARFLPLLDPVSRSRRSASSRPTSAAVRQQDSRLPGRQHGRLRFQDAGRAGEVDRDAERELPSTIHGRDHVQEVEIAAKKDGTILGIRARGLGEPGRLPSTASTGVPTILHG